MEDDGGDSDSNRCPHCGAPITAGSVECDGCRGAKVVLKRVVKHAPKGSDHGGVASTVLPEARVKQARDEGWLTDYQADVLLDLTAAATLLNFARKAELYILVRQVAEEKNPDMRLRSVDALVNELECASCSQDTVNRLMSAFGMRNRPPRVDTGRGNSTGKGHLACSYCGYVFSSDLNACPRCGSVLRNPNAKK